jgi:hypothetical protein
MSSWAALLIHLPACLFLYELIYLSVETADNIAVGAGWSFYPTSGVSSTWQREHPATTEAAPLFPNLQKGEGPQEQLQQNCRLPLERNKTP